MKKNSRLKDQIRKLPFIPKKLYSFLTFIFLSLINLALGFIYFLISLFIYIKNLLTASVPMDIIDNIKVDTYVYKKTKNKNLKMDLYYPNTVNKFSPLIYFCHGGAWISGFRDQPNNVSWCNFLASRGFIVASIDYRYGYSNTMLDLLEDYFDGLKFIRKHNKTIKADLNNITLMGLSAGGHLSLLFSSYLTYNKYYKELEGVRSVVAYYPPTNLKDLVNNKNSKSLLAKFGASKTLKGSPSAYKDVYKYYSPNTWLSSRMPPVLLVHGKNDQTVPFSSSVNFAKDLDSYGIKHNFLVHNTADHSFDTKLKDYFTINILEQTVRFIKLHLL